jgi:general secretion pathway protein A
MGTMRDDVITSELPSVASDLARRENGTGIAEPTDVLAVMGLREPPFTENVSDIFFFPSQQHLRALGFIGQLLWSRANLGVITGERGIGKSLLIRRLLSDLDERVLLAHVQSEAVDPQEFLRDVLKQFDIELNEADRTDRRRLLNRFLTHQFGQNRICMLVVEGVQNLRPAVLEELRLIAELAVDGKRAVKLMLLGDHALNRVIDSPRMASLVSGRVPRIAIESFSEDQVAAYVAHRLRAAGAIDPDSLASPTLVPQIHRYTSGIPRLINRLCENALAVALDLGDVRLSARALTRAAEALHVIPTSEQIEAIADSNPGETKEEQALLLVSTQGIADGVVPLMASRILIGRSELADVRIDSAFVSRYHSLIVRENGQDLLIDLGSTNGVLVNGKRVVRAVLKHRDLIQVGPSRVTYLNPAIAPPLEGDSSATVSFARPGVPAADDGNNAVLAFGRLDEAG